jgi:hypothetical protein
MPRPSPADHGRAVAWFQAWCRARRSGDARLLELAQAELRRLGVEVRAVPGEVRP